MGIMPTVKKQSSFLLKTCSVCGGSFGAENFTRSKSLFCGDGYLPLCNDCIRKILVRADYSWDVIDRLCQYADVPFVPAEFEKYREMSPSTCFITYVESFFGEGYERLDWKTYYNEFKKLKESGYLEDEIPLVSDEKIRKLQEKWGGSYSPEDLRYLENLLEGITSTQNINSSLQSDQALKICKMSLAIDKRIEANEDFDKLLSSYDKLVKVAEFTPKNAKNASDFDSVGELVMWLEKRGFKPNFYNDVTRDVVDETLKNIQNFNRRLYTNETGISEEITRRIEALKSAEEVDSFYGTDLNDFEDLDNYDNEGYGDLMNEEFNPNLDGDDSFG